MTAQRLRLVKARSKAAGSRPVKPYRSPRLKRYQPEDLSKIVSFPSDPSGDWNFRQRMSPAEANEAARFRALTVAKATRRATIQRTQTELEQVDQPPPAA